MRTILLVLLAILYVLFGFFVLPWAVHVVIMFGSLIWLCLLPAPQNANAGDRIMNGIISAIPPLALAFVATMFASLAIVRVWINISMYSFSNTDNWILKQFS